MIKSEATIYIVLERLLKAAGDSPQTCVDLFDASGEVRELVGSGGANRVSDYLGHMWRRGLVSRFYAAQTTARARYAYTWKEAAEGVVTPKKLADAKNRTCPQCPSPSPTSRLQRVTGV
jgi:hypothetical protein